MLCFRFCNSTLSHPRCSSPGSVPPSTIPLAHPVSSTSRCPETTSGSARTAGTPAASGVMRTLSMQTRSARSIGPEPVESSRSFGSRRLIPRIPAVSYLHLAVRFVSCRRIVRVSAASPDPIQRNPNSHSHARNRSRLFAGVLACAAATTDGRFGRPSVRYHVSCVTDSRASLSGTDSAIRSFSFGGNC